MLTDVRHPDALPRHTRVAPRSSSWRQPVWARGPRPFIERAFEVTLLGALLGYLLFNRGFAWLHVPGTPLFVGEMVLALGVVMLTTTRVRVDRLIGTATPLAMLCLFITWCAVRAGPGVLTYGIDAIRDLAIAYYGVFAVLVGALLVGRRGRLDHWFDRYGQILPIALLWLGPAVLLAEVFGEGPPYVPDSEVSVFSHKIHSAALQAMMALLFLWLLRSGTDLRFRRRRAVLTSLSVGVLGIAVLLNRGAFVAVSGALGVLWLLDRRRAGMVVARIVTIGVIAMVVALTFDLRVPAMSGSGRELSAQQFIDNVVSVVDPSEANQDLSGTADWRLQYWERLVSDVNREEPLVGFGFGLNLRERFGEQDEEVPARDAHNSHIGIYARSGLIGLALWAMVWWTWFAHVLRTRRAARAHGDSRTANITGWLVAAITAMLINAFFDPALEGPQTAIWFWTLFGIGAVLRPRRVPATERAPFGNLTVPARSGGAA